MRPLGFLAFVFPLLVVVACSSNDDEKSCTLIGCDEGLDIAFNETQAGSYAVEIIVDGTTSTCATTLPLPADATDRACSSADVLLTRSGSALPAAQQSIGGLRISRTDAKSITVRVTRDGMVVRDATFAPSYTVTPGPNGPGCSPEQCTSGSFTLP